MSNNTYYNIYLNNNIELASSMIIKLELVANAMNLELQHNGYEVSIDKSTWRYYYHLAGNYHFFDQKMYIKSLDDGTTIIYSKENLKHHKKTRALYKEDVSYLNELYDKYPTQSNLIRGVLYPIDISTALNSKDGAILYYNHSFTEPQEYNLIIEVEQWIASYLYRVSMQAYSESDDLFAASVCGLLYVNLPQVIMNVRSNYIKTSQVHTFHISSYLASYNRLDEFMPYMSFEQQLFIYLNIDYIVRHTGMLETFNLLLEKLLTERNLPVFDYMLQQANIDVGNGLQPIPMFTKDKLNLDSGLLSRSLNALDVRTVINKQAYQATNNAEMVDYYAKAAETQASQSSISKLPTKLLEVSAIDPEDNEPTKLVDVIINEWAFHATNGSYSNNIEIINPLNGDPLKIDILDAFVLYLYSYSKGFIGQNLTTIPKFLAYDISKYKWVPDTEYRALAPASEYGAWDRHIDFFISSNIELNEEIRLASEFLDRCYLLTQYRNTRYQWVENCSRFDERATVANFFDYSYSDVWCNIDQKHYQDYNTFFLNYGINADLIDTEMWKDIAMDCLDKATNFTNSNTISLRDIQSSMVKLFKRLSSYTIQFLEEIASSDSSVAKGTVVIPGETGISSAVLADIQNIKITALDAGALATCFITNITEPVSSLYVEYDNDVRLEATVGVDVFGSYEYVSSACVTLGQTKVLKMNYED